MDILAKLFGSSATVRLLRLFILNPATVFEQGEIVRRARITATMARSELAKLFGAHVIKRKSTAVLPDNAPATAKKKRVQGWILDRDFEHLAVFESFLSDISPFSDKDLLQKLATTAKIKLVIVSGIFIKDQNSRVDIVVVGDAMKQNRIDGAIARIEAEMGRELRYVSMETSEFVYRIGMYDKLIRDVLDFPHRVILDKIGIDRYYSVKK